jgi:hypothetical protein
MARTIEIPRQFCGPPDSGNGGWTCGTLAGFVDGDAVVTLRSPPPLDTPLAVEERDDGVHLVHGEVLVAVAAPTTLAAPPTPFVDPHEAEAASRSYAGFIAHPFPTCFTCGTARDLGDGLRVFPGPVAGAPERRAAIWTAHPDFAVDGVVPEPIVWAAIDCPSIWPHMGDGTVAVLGRLAAHVERLPEPGQSYVVVGNATGAEGRKRFATSGLFDLDGTPLAWADATWITIAGAGG